MLGRRDTFYALTPSDIQQVCTSASVTEKMQIFRARFSCNESNAGQNLQGTFAIHGSKAPLSAVGPFVSLWKWMDVMVLGVSNSQLIYLRFCCIKILLIIYCLHFFISYFLFWSFWLSITFSKVGDFSALCGFTSYVDFISPCLVFPCCLLPLPSRSVFMPWSSCLLV